MSKTADLIFDKTLTAENVEAKLAEMGSLNLKMREYRKKEYDDFNARGI